jgi:hypothetical protein
MKSELRSAGESTGSSQPCFSPDEANLDGGAFSKDTMLQKRLNQPGEQIDF